MILERGTLLNNRYRIIEILGQGGMGSVYRAVDENLGVEVAVKDNLFTTEEYARQFRREAVILASLRHSNLPRVTDHFVISGKGQYLVMDYIEGEDLRQRMERIGPVPEEEVVTIGAAVCDALTYLGTRNPAIIHRDIKPGNVKITPQGHIFLVDFGLAKTLSGTQSTTTGARAMTPGYSPPEQYGTARTDQRSDIFSLGATLYAALTGCTPEDALARAMEQADLTPINKHTPNVSKRLAEVIEKALEVRPDERFQTAVEFKQSLLDESIAKQKNGDYLVAPPPFEEESLSSGGSQPPGVQPPDANSVKKVPEPAPSGAAEQDLSPALSDKLARRRNWARGCVWLMLLIALLLTGFSVILRNDPSLPNRAIAIYLPTINARIMTSTPTSILVVANLPTSTANPIRQTPTEEATQTPKIPPTHENTATVSPTPTITSVPTPTGGGGGVIAFVSDRVGANQIFFINSDGSDLTQVTNIAEGACQPDWSPDGKRLVFISPCKSNSDFYQGASMYIMNIDGTGLLPLPTMVGGDYDPKWSPDGDHILFTSLRNSQRPQLFVLDLANNYSITPLSDKYSFDFQGSWSPDGKQIIFISTRHTKQEVWVMDADGKNQHVFSQSPSDALDSHPSWSSDMQTVLFTQSFSATGIPRVVVVPYNKDNSAEYRIGQEALPMRDGTYSPDGYWIAFEGWEAGGDHNIYIIAVTGAIRTKLTDDAFLDFDPAWKPAP